MAVHHELINHSASICRFLDRAHGASLSTGNGILFLKWRVYGKWRSFSPLQELLHASVSSRGTKERKRSFVLERPMLAGPPCRRGVFATQYITSPLL